MCKKPSPCSALQQDQCMGDPLPQAQSTLVPSLVIIIHHPELQQLVLLGSKEGEMSSLKMPGK